MSKKEISVSNENVEKIIMALDVAVPKGSKSYEVVYALCYLLANIFIHKPEKRPNKEEFFFIIEELISDMIDDYENN